MKVVLLGADGQLGTDLSRMVPKDIQLIPLTIEDVDIRNRDKIINILTDIMPEIILNTAAFVRVDDCEDEGEIAFGVNAMGVKNLVDVCRRLNCTMVYISTDYVFDGKKMPQPYYEYDIPNPLNIYGMSKYAGELIIQNYLEKYYIVRTASLYGKRGAEGKGGNFITAILNKAKHEEKLSVVNDIIISSTYTIDASKEIWHIILNTMPYGIYHVTNSGYCSWYDFAKKILELAGIVKKIAPVLHTEYPTKAKRSLWSVLESRRGIKLRSWEEALEVFMLV